MLQAAEDERGDQFSHESRLNYNDGGKLSAFAGVSYFYSNVSQRVPLQFDERMALTLVAGQNTYLQSQPASFFSSAYFTNPMGGSTPMGLGTTIVAALAYTPVYTAAYNQAYTGYYNALVGPYGATVAAAQAKSLATTAATTYATGFVNTAVSSLKANHWEQSTNYGKTKSVDLYADVTYKLFDALEVEGGARYTNDDKQTAYSGKTADTSELGILLASLRNAPTGAGEGVMVQPTANNGDKIGYNFGDEGLSWRFTARYALEDTTSIYATYARGRRPKVYSAKTPAVPYTSSAYVGPTFQEAPAEEVDSYEIGAKTAAFDNTLRLDTAFYFYDYSNFQSTKLVNQQYLSFNAGKAEAYGFESTADWALTGNVDFFGTLSASRARFVGDSAYHGDQFRLNPDVKFSLGASLRHEFFGGTLNFLPTYTWQSKTFFDDNNDRPDLQTTAAGNLIADTKQDEYQNAYGLLNLRLSYQRDNAPWSASVFVTNVLDQKFIKDAGNSGDNLGIPTFIAGEPRFFGASLTFKTH
jgi:outer membrane receptor protein involved in Fe transport